MIMGKFLDFNKEMPCLLHLTSYSYESSFENNGNRAFFSYKKILSDEQTLIKEKARF